MTPSFTRAELACRCCGLAQFHPGFLTRLQELRDAFGEPMKVNSACRCINHNVALGAAVRSFHIGDQPQHAGQQGTMAIDIATPSGPYRGKLFAEAWARGWSIGWNAKRGFLHLDRRVDVGLPQTSFDY